MLIAHTRGDHMLKLSNRVRSLSSSLGRGLARIGLPSTIAPPVKFGHSKYMPHIGAKERERAKRLCLSVHLNQRFVSDALDRGIALTTDMCHERSTPTLCQMSKRRYAALLAREHA
jgi:hypothetical protein